LHRFSKDFNSAVSGFHECEVRAEKPATAGKDERMVSMHKFRFLVDKGRGDALKSRKGCDGEDVRHPRFRDAAVGASRGKGPKVGRSRAGRKKGPVPQ